MQRRAGAGSGIRLWDSCYQLVDAHPRTPAPGRPNPGLHRPWGGGGRKPEGCDIPGRFMGKMSCVFVSQPCLPRGNPKPHILLPSVISSHFHQQHLVLIIKRYSPRCSIKILASLHKENKII